MVENGQGVEQAGGRESVTRQPTTELGTSMQPFQMDAVHRIPLDVRELRQWVLWKLVPEPKDPEHPKKMPFQIHGCPAKPNDPATWSSFDDVMQHMPGYLGPGYVFAAEDPYCGVDFDACRDPKSGEVSDWAREWIKRLDSYTEVSPSRTGVKVWVRGKSPFDKGRNQKLPELGELSGKMAGIEMYDHGRFFCVTGMRMKVRDEIQERQDVLNRLGEHFWKPEPAKRFYQSRTTSLEERAARYIAMIPGGVSGQKGSSPTFRTACLLVLGFSLPLDVAFRLLSEWNQKCTPPWSDQELWHKINDANKQEGERGYLVNVAEQQWDQVKVPRYEPPPVIKTLQTATNEYIDRLRAGGGKLISLGVADLDYAIGGGVEEGEVVILAARTSHGKSAVALQCIHNLTAAGMPCAMISEEMSSYAIGKRVIQYASTTPEEHWYVRLDDISKDASNHFVDRAPCILIESCRTVDRATAAVRQAIAEHGVKVVAIDYAQILRGQGATPYERTTQTSIAIRNLASDTGVIVLLLCQLNRQVEAREKFVPKASDIRDSGQLEQDADVVITMVWPHKVDSKNPPHLFCFYVCKNRNRGINSAEVKCEFRPSRQIFLSERIQDHPGYVREFDEWGG